MGWRRKSLRPEELYGDARDYFALVKPSSGMRRAQFRLTRELVDLMAIEPPARVVDLGCGWGFSMEVLASLGFEVVGVDISSDMVGYCRAKGFQAIVGDFCRLDRLFPAKSFDHAVSVSSLQWVSKSAGRLRSLARSLKKVVRFRYGFQFYPYSEEELRLVERIFSKYLSSAEVVFVARGTKKERIYVVGDV